MGTSLGVMAVLALTRGALAGPWADSSDSPNVVRTVTDPGHGRRVLLQNVVEDGRMQELWWRSEVSSETVFRQGEETVSSPTDNVVQMTAHLRVDGRPARDGAQRAGLHILDLQVDLHLDPRLEAVPEGQRFAAGQAEFADRLRALSGTSGTISANRDISLASEVPGASDLLGLLAVVYVPLPGERLGEGGRWEERMQLGTEDRPEERLFSWEVVDVTRKTVVVEFSCEWVRADLPPGIQGMRLLFEGHYVLARQGRGVAPDLFPAEAVGQFQVVSDLTLPEVDAAHVVNTSRATLSSAPPPPFDAAATLPGPASGTP